MKIGRHVSSAFVAALAERLQAFAGGDYCFHVDPVVWPALLGAIALVPRCRHLVRDDSDARFDGASSSLISPETRIPRCRL